MRTFVVVMFGAMLMLSAVASWADGGNLNAARSVPTGAARAS